MSENNFDPITGSEQVNGSGRSTQSADSAIRKDKSADWESELAERIAKRVQQSKENKASKDEDIMAILDRAIAAEKKSQADIEAERRSLEAGNVPVYDTVSHEREQQVRPEINGQSRPESIRQVQPEFSEQLHSENVRKVHPEKSVQSRPHMLEQDAEPVYLHTSDLSKPLTRDELQRESFPEEPEAPPEIRETPSKKKKKKKKTFKQRMLGLIPHKGDSVLECIRKIVFLAAVIAIIVCGYKVADYYIDLWKSERLNDQVMDLYWTYQDGEDVQPSTEKVINDDGDEEIRQKYYMLPGARKLLDMNSDVVGVIKIPDTNVNNPVMQASDNDKYLNRKINGEESRNGEIFMDYRNHFDDVDDDGYLKEPNSDNLIIYGHNMGDDSMFGSLKYYHRNSDYYGQHPVIELNSNYMTYKYKIFAFFILDAEDKTETKFDCWNKLNFSDEKDFYNFVNEAKRRTIRLNDVDVKYGDKLVTLSTCNTYLGDRGRLIIMGRLVRDGEDPLKGTQNSVPNPNIKWPTMYYNTKTNEKYDPKAEFKPYGP